MQLDAQAFLRLVETQKTLMTWDTEATGLRGDYNSILVVSVKPFGQKPQTWSVAKPGQDKALVTAVKATLDTADCWVTYYGKGFDLPMFNTRLLRWGLEPLRAVHHLDMYYMLRYRLLTARRSQGHLLDWLGCDNQKMSVGAETWNDVLSDPQALDILRKRCESDCKGLEDLYRRTKHLVRQITT